MATVYTPPEHPGQPTVGTQPLSPSDERTWALLAHLSVLVNLFTGFLGPVIALVIYLVYKDRSRYVAYQSLQSLVLQLTCWIGAGIVATILWIVAGLLTVICIGVILYPLAIIASLLPVVALIYGVVAAIQTSQGVDFKYWLIGDWVRDSFMH